MKVSELYESTIFKGKNAKSTWVFLDINGVPFKKKLRKDNTGADFTMTDAKSARKVFNYLKNHKKINQNFNMKIDRVKRWCMWPIIQKEK